MSVYVSECLVRHIRTQKTSSSKDGVGVAVAGGGARADQGGGQDDKGTRRQAKANRPVGWG